MRKQSAWLREPGVVVFTLLICVVGLIGCEKSGTDHGHPHGDAATKDKETAAAPSHGKETELGNVTIASREFHVVLLGDVVPGKESAFEVQGVGDTAAELSKLNLYLWLEEEGGTQLSAPAKGDLEGTGLHFHVTPRAGKGDPSRVVLRLRGDGVDERGGLPLSGHGHEHHDGPHDGMVASFVGKSGTKGFVELKLHDDKGDLELWIAKDEKITDPLDLPVDAAIEVEFIDVAGRRVSLRARNRTENEDEDGNPNLRSGRTNYFIYPSKTDEDASWLQGKEFSSIVVVRFTFGGAAVESEEFVLKPHVH